MSTTAATGELGRKSGFNRFGESNYFVTGGERGSDKLEQGMNSWRWGNMSMDDGEERPQVEGHTRSKVRLQGVDASQGMVIVSDVRYDSGRGWSFHASWVVWWCSGRIVAMSLIDDVQVGVTIVTIRLLIDVTFSISARPRAKLGGVFGVNVKSQGVE